jgi:hypothetical protein
MRMAMARAPFAEEDSPRVEMLKRGALVIRSTPV